MSIDTSNFHNYEIGDWPLANDLNSVRRNVKKLCHSLAVEGIIGSDGLAIRQRRIRSAVAIKKARIIATLQREDHLLGLPEIDYYTIELIGSEIADWDENHGIYFEGDVVKDIDNSVTKSYVCEIEHEASLALKPSSTPSHWTATSNLEALVFGYSGDLLETIPWFQPNDIVNVIYYEDPRFTQTWWILETVIRVEEEGVDEITGDPIIICSMTWDAEDNRAKAVYS
ncbi:MAG: hypothetical protein ACW990_02320 [Promethearchaeota archaeon]|jgi:hypothetical protein